MDGKTQALGDGGFIAIAIIVLAPACHDLTGGKRRAKVRTYFRQLQVM